MSAFRPGDEVVVTLDRDHGHLPCQGIFVAEEATNSVVVVAAEACPELDAIELKACQGEGISRVIFVSVATLGLESRQLPALPGTVVLISPNLKDVMRIYYQDQGNTSDLSAVTARSSPLPNGAAPAAASSSARGLPSSAPPEASGLQELARNMMRELQDMKAEMAKMQAPLPAAHAASRSPDFLPAERSTWSVPVGRTTWSDVLGPGTGGKGNGSDVRRKTWIHDEEDDEEESSADEQPRFPRQTTGPPRGASSWEPAGLRGHSAGPGRDRERPATSLPASSLDAVNLEMLKTLRSMRKRRGNSGSSGSEHSGSETDLFDGHRTKGFGGIHNMRRLLKKKPNRFTLRYVERMKDKLGVRSSRQYWRPSDYSRLLLPRFGRMRGLWRTHFMLSETLEVLLEGNMELGVAMVCQQLKVVHQVALDHGGWDSALLLWAHEDPLGAEAFGGEELEMEKVHRYQKAKKELCTSISRAIPEQNGDDDQASPKGGGVGKGKRKTKATANGAAIATGAVDPA